MHVCKIIRVYMSTCSYVGMCVTAAVLEEHMPLYFLGSEGECAEIKEDVYLVGFKFSSV